MQTIGFWNIAEKLLFPLCVKYRLQPQTLSYWAYQCTSVFRNGSTLASDCDWLQRLPVPCSALPSPSLPSLLWFWPCCQLMFQEGGGGETERKRRIPSAQGQGPDGRRHSSSRSHSAPGPLRSQLHAGVQSVHSCQSSACEQHRYQFFTIPAKNSQWYHPSFLHPSFPSQAKWNNNKLQTLARCVITDKYHHPTNEIPLVSQPVDPTLP